MASAFSSASSDNLGSRQPTTATLTSEPLKAPAAMINDNTNNEAAGNGTGFDNDDELSKLKHSLQREKAAKRKMYGYLVKIADELKVLREESDHLRNAADYSRKAWYEGGMWRGPNVLPTAAATSSSSPNISLHKRKDMGGSNIGGDGYSRVGGNENNYNNNNYQVREGTTIHNAPTMVPRAPVSLSDLFLDMVTVTSFSKVGVAIQDRGTIDLPILAYFAVFWQIWSKEASYSTRFDTTDISSHLETLLACFALLGGSLSAYSDFHSDGCTRIMGVAMFVAFLHVALHARVWYWFNHASVWNVNKNGNNGNEGRDDSTNSMNQSVKRYAIFIAVMNTLEMINWAVGMSLPNESHWRPWIFLMGFVLNLRLPRGFMPNDFHAACSKRGVLFLLLLGFNLQNICGDAYAYFNYWEPSWEQYAFLFLACFLLFMIKLLYVDDTYAVAPQDHALLYNRAAGFCFHVGNFALLLFTTVLGSGLNLLTHSFLAAAVALPSDAKNLVCGGFAAVVFSIAFIKSMHIRRVPTDPKHERMFFIAYLTQAVGIIAVVAITARMCFLPPDLNSGLGLLMRNEIEMLAVLVSFAVVLIGISWLDEAIELRLYSDASEASEYRVQPFGIWACFKQDEPLQLQVLAMERNRSNGLARNSLLFRPSVMSFGSMYNSFANLPSEETNA